MHAVLICRPETLELIATGLQAEDVDKLETENMLWGGSACHGDHPWTPADAVLGGTA